MREIISILILSVAGAILFSSCTMTTTHVRNAPGRPTHYVDTRSPSGVQGVGIETQDVTSMTDVMVRDLLATPVISSRATPPRIIIDAQYFVNESSSRINKNIIVNKIRTALNRDSEGKMIFIERERTDMIERERGLKREGLVDQGTTGPATKTFGADFRMAGRITSMDAIDPKTGLQQRTHFIFFRMVDLETGAIVWEDSYEFGKVSQEDIIYR